MAGQTIPTEEVSDIFFSRTPLVIGTADSIKNLGESNVSTLDGNDILNANEGELHTLSDLGVASINQTSTFTTTTGETKAINDVWFMTNNMDTARDTTITLKDSVAALPDYHGAGRAENLSTAMNENAKLETAVSELLTKTAQIKIHLKAA